MITTTEMTVNNRHVAKGTEISIQGERGRFRFVKHVQNNQAEWIDVWGGPKGREQMRSFRPNRIKRVHYKNQTAKSLLEKRKASA